MKKLLVLVACVVVAGCAAKVLSSSPRSVIVTGPRNAFAEIQKLGDAECQKHGRHARMVGRPFDDPNQFMFDSVN